MRKLVASERFLSLVDIREENECWPFKGYIGKNRYGSLKINGKNMKAHRFAYEVKNGAVPSGLAVLHKCNNPRCCNPSHLVAGTLSENMRHASSSGSFGIGSSGVRGVNFSKARKSWRARASMNGSPVILYQGPSKEKAIAAREQWEAQHGISFQLTGSRS